MILKCQQNKLKNCMTFTFSISSGLVEAIWVVLWCFHRNLMKHSWILFFWHSLIIHNVWWRGSTLPKVFFQGLLYLWAYPEHLLLIAFVLQFVPVIFFLSILFLHTHIHGEVHEDGLFPTSVVTHWSLMPIFSVPISTFYFNVASYRSCIHFPSGPMVMSKSMYCKL